MGALIQLILAVLIFGTLVLGAIKNNVFDAFLTRDLPAETSGVIKMIPAPSPTGTPAGAPPPTKQSRPFSAMPPPLPTKPLPEVEKISAAATTTPSLPPPLESQTKKAAPETQLSREGVLRWTNFYRSEAGFVTLAENSQLNAAAELKLQDMFSNKYFAHIAPSGLGASDFVQKTMYQFLSVGENLALGNFGDDKILVEAWMASPGHKANILGKYNDIGVAAGKGSIPDPSSGEIIETWLVVQVFARPLSVCPGPDGALRINIDSLETEITNLSAKAKELRAEIELQEQPKTKEEYDIYVKKVEDHNNLINKVNDLIDEVKRKIETYNLQVSIFNNCVAS